MDEVTKTITFLEEKIASSTDSIKQGYEDSLAQAQETLKTLLKDAAKPAPAKESSTEAYKKNANVKSIEYALSETHFNGLDLSETRRFIERLDKIYQITVENVDATLEADFLKLVKLRISDLVYKNMVNSKIDISTFQKFKSWIKTTYGGQFHAYQVLTRAWDIEFRPQEKFTNYAQRVGEELSTSLASIQKQHKEINGTQSDLTLDGLMGYMSGLLVTNNLRTHCFPIFRDMTNDFNKMESGLEVAAKAEYYRERLGGTEYLGSTGNSYWSNPKPNVTPKHKTKTENKIGQQKGYDKRGPNEKQSWSYSKNGKPLTCFKCGKPGHIQFHCKTPMANIPPKPDFRNTNTKLAEIKDEPKPMESIFAPTSPFQ